MQRKELIDLGFSSPPFTWERDWVDWGFIEERLDRALVNNLWMEHWPNTCVSHGPLLGSDHRPLIINTCPQFVSSPKPFKFEAYWTTDSECASIKRDDDTWIENEVDIRNQFERHFISLFTSDGPKDSWEALNGIQKMGGLKAPGPDWFQGMFYHNYWQSINEVINGAASEFFQHGLLSPVMNHTNIMLIPKIPNPESGSFVPNRQI
ncbi:hypothetical protein ACFX14_002983 [Malus domestica]